LFPNIPNIPEDVEAGVVVPVVVGTESNSNKK